MAVAHVVDLAARQSHVVRGCGDRLDPEIDAKKIVHGIDGRVRNITGRGQVELAAVIDQVGFSLLQFQSSF